MDALALGAVAAAALRIPSVVASASSRAPARDYGSPPSRSASPGRSLTARLLPSQRPLGNTVEHDQACRCVFARRGFSARRSTISRSAAAGLRSRASARCGSRGNTSYGTYVFDKPLHDFVGKPLVRRLGLQLASSALGSLAYIVVVGTATFGVAFLSFHLFRRPIPRLKAKYAPRAATG